MRTSSARRRRGSCASCTIRTRRISRPDKLRSLNESTSGHYAGLGIQIDVRDGWITIVAPLPGTPAERAGIQPGDRIVGINGKSTEGDSPDDARGLLRGPNGSPVTLLIERPGVAGRMSFALARSEIRVHSVRHASMIGEGVGYLALTIFSDSSATEVQQAVEKLRSQGMKTLVFDLRANPGGLLSQGIEVADLFLDPGQPIVTVRGREATQSFADDAKQQWPDLKVITLVDEHSASASEIVAGALQDHDRAAIVGSTSYGKGSAQSVFSLDDSASALKLTTARWFTPSGRSIQKPPVKAPGDDDDEDSAPAVGAAADSGGEVPLSKRQQFKTDDGRVVYGGGGITPDLLVAPSDSINGTRAFWQLIGAGAPKFRDALTESARRGAHCARGALAGLHRHGLAAPVAVAARRGEGREARSRAVRFRERRRRPAPRHRDRALRTRPRGGVQAPHEQRSRRFRGAGAVEWCASGDRPAASRRRAARGEARGRSTHDMTTPTARVFVIGAGRAGRALAHAMRVARIDVVGLHGRRPAEGTTWGEWPRSLGSATIVLVTVRDAELDGVLRDLLEAPLAAGAVVLHASGTTEPPALDALRAKGHPGGTFHPLLPLTDPTRATEQLKRAWIGIDGDEHARGAARDLATAIGARVLDIPDGAKARYHAAAVIASNFPIVLLAMATRVLTEAGVSEEAARGALGTLLTAAAENARAAEPSAALTGPVARGDVETVRAHLAALADNAGGAGAVSGAVEGGAARWRRGRVRSARRSRSCGGCWTRASSTR